MRVVKPQTRGPECLGHFHPWRYSRLGWQRPWVVLFPGWKGPTNFESRSNLEFGPALSEGLSRWLVDILFNLNYSVSLWIQARSAAKILSISVLLFFSLASLAGLFCLVRDVSYCSSLSCPTRWRPWPDPQGAITAVMSLWKTKEFLSLRTAGIINLNWSKRNNETQYHKRTLRFFLS